MLYSIYAESTPNPEVMKFVANRPLTVNSIEVTSEDEVKDDALAWNCLNRNKYSKND